MTIQTLARNTNHVTLTRETAVHFLFVLGFSCFVLFFFNHNFNPSEVIYIVSCWSTLNHRGVRSEGGCIVIMMQCDDNFWFTIGAVWILFCVVCLQSHVSVSDWVALHSYQLHWHCREILNLNIKVLLILPFKPPDAALLRTWSLRDLIAFRGKRLNTVWGNNTVRVRSSIPHVQQLFH